MGKTWEQGSANKVYAGLGRSTGPQEGNSANRQQKPRQHNTSRHNCQDRDITTQRAISYSFSAQNTSRYLH